MESVFTIDGVSYPGVGVERIRRKAELRDGKNAGDLMSGEYARDLVGTFYHYSMSLSGAEPGSADYDALYEVLTAPVDSHQVVVPYGQQTLAFTAYVKTASDEMEPMEGDENWWCGLTIEFRAKEPKRYPV